MHFGENQLSRSLIGLSPLPTAHPLHFQLKWVRSSTTSYRRFNLAMGRSLRFGSRPCHSIALFRLAFAMASPHGLTSRHSTNSQAHSSKGTPSPHKEALTVCRHTVSGTVSLPSRGTFHLSLTVLVRYRSSGSIQAYQVVLADSHGIPRAPCYSGNSTQERQHNRLRDSHPLWPAFQDRSPRAAHSLRQAGRPATTVPTTPMMQPLPGMTHHRFSLIRVRSPLLTESLLFSLPMGTEMFHFPTFPPHGLCVQPRVTTHRVAGFPHSDILGSPLGYQLPQAYRRFPRPSSAPDAKASTVRP